jgi:hypothetical protein
MFSASSTKYLSLYTISLLILLLVFFVSLSFSCLHQVARPNCPLCRNPFDTRYTIKLHVDLDAIKPVSPDDIPVPSDSDEGARQLQSRITKVASDGATEIQTTQLTEECKKFLLTVPKEMVRTLP